MTNVLVALCLCCGSLLILIAALGVLRMPDAYMRLSVASKASTLGAGLVLAAAALHFGEAGLAGRVAAILVFISMTTPIGAHRIARAAYIAGIPLWECTRVDELRGRYDPETHVLGSPPAHRASPGDRAPPGDRAE